MHQEINTHFRALLYNSVFIPHGSLLIVAEALFSCVPGLSMFISHDEVKKKKSSNLAIIDLTTIRKERTKEKQFSRETRGKRALKYRV